MDLHRKCLVEKGNLVSPDRSQNFAQPLGPTPNGKKNILGFHFIIGSLPLVAVKAVFSQRLSQRIMFVFYNDQLSWQKKLTKSIGFGEFEEASPRDRVTVGVDHHISTSHHGEVFAWDDSWYEMVITLCEWELRVEEIWSPTTTCIVFFITRIVPLLVSKDSAEHSLSTWWDHHEIRNLRIIG